MLRACCVRVCFPRREAGVCCGPRCSALRWRLRVLCGGGVVWCGVVWCGVVWCGVVWCGVVWCGVVWCGVVWCGVVWCGTVCMKVAHHLHNTTPGEPHGKLYRLGARGLDQG